MDWQTQDRFSSSPKLFIQGVVVMKTTAAFLATVFATAAFSAAATNNGLNIYSESYNPSSNENTGPSKSRAEVVAELRQARAAGLIVEGSEQGPVFETPVASEKTREQVAAETREARRLGFLSYDEQGPRDATPAELEAIRVAGMSAVEGQSAQAE
jgi:hypothetical protein